MGGGRRARVASFARMRSCSVGWGIFALIHAIGHWYINISLRGSGPLRSTAVDVGRRRGRRAALGPKPVRAQVSPASRASRARRSQSYSKSGWVTSSIESARLLNNPEITWAMGPSVVRRFGDRVPVNDNSDSNHFIFPNEMGLGVHIFGFQLGWGMGFHKYRRGHYYIKVFTGSSPPLLLPAAVAGRRRAAGTPELR